MTEPTMVSTKVRSPTENAYTSMETRNERQSQPRNFESLKQDAIGYSFLTQVPISDYLQVEKDKEKRR